MTADLTDVQRTSLSTDILGRYICNTFQEAACSAEVNPCLNRPETRPDARPFDLIVIGRGTFGAAMAEHLWFRDKTRSHRILVLDGGPFAVPEHVQNLPMIGLGVADATTVRPAVSLSRFCLRAVAAHLRRAQVLLGGLDVPGLEFADLSGNPDAADALLE